VKRHILINMCMYVGRHIHIGYFDILYNLYDFHSWARARYVVIESRDVISDVTVRFCVATHGFPGSL